MRNRTAPYPLALACLSLACLFAGSARADEEDLSDSSRHNWSSKPSTLAVLVSGGTTYSPFGNIGGALSYYNDFTQAEIEAGAGGGFPGVQFGGNLRKLFGGGGEYIVLELGFGYNKRKLEGANPSVIDSGSHAWTNLGLGFEHRAGPFVVGFSGGTSFAGFQSPSFYLRASVGFGIF